MPGQWQPQKPAPRARTAAAFIIMALWLGCGGADSAKPGAVAVAGNCDPAACSRSGRQCVVEGVNASLDEFVARAEHDELWLIEDGSLHRLGISFGDWQTMELPFSPTHINKLPTHDLLILTAENALHFFDPNTREIVGRAALD